MHVCPEPRLPRAGIPKGQYKGYTCPACSRAKVSAQHLRQKEKRKKGSEKITSNQTATISSSQGPKRELIRDVPGLLNAILADCEADHTTLHATKTAFKRLLQIQRALKAEEDQLLNEWKSFSRRNFLVQCGRLREHFQPAYILATSLLKLTSQASVDGEGDEVNKKRHEVCEKIMSHVPGDLMDSLDASQEYGRCESL